MPASLFVDPTLLTMSTTHKFPSQLAGEGELGTVHGALVSDQGTAAARLIAGKGKLISLCFGSGSGKIYTFFCLLSASHNLKLIYKKMRFSMH